MNLIRSRVKFPGTTVSQERRPVAAVDEHRNIVESEAQEEREESVENEYIII